MTDKKYGLILSEKNKAPKFQARRNVFGNDSDSEEETSKKSFLLRPSDITKRQAKICQEKAVLEDPTVYQYDEIYEEMVGVKEKETTKSKEEKKPRYIENLMKAAHKRKIENERRMERQIQKEREEEGEEFKGKEVFVTSAYKKKLEEMRQEEEKEKREEYLEKIGDVTKQKDLGGFYRHLYEQKLGKDKITESKKETTPDKEDIPKASVTLPVKDENAIAENAKKRNYRKRKPTATNHDLSEGEPEDSDNEINRLNLENIRLAKKNKKAEENIDADSDFSVDDPSEEENESEKVCKDKKLNIKELTPKRSLTPEIKPVTEKDEQKLIKEVLIEAKPIIDIWKKRTVGDVFDQALKRYYERKASRGA